MQHMNLNSEINNSLIDISHHNEAINFEELKSDGIVGFIHKSTQGEFFVDSKFLERAEQGLSLSLLVGAYHFGVDGNVEKQVDSFIGVLELLLSKSSSFSILPCLDWEPNPNTKEGTMSLTQAIDFVECFHRRTGVYPTIYGGYWMIEQLRNKQVPSFSQCPLWQGYYKIPINIATSIWDSWTLWQYTDGKNGPLPHSVAGIGPVDRNVFNGTLQELMAFWRGNCLRAK